jgi:hypothetical protein
LQGVQLLRSLGLLELVEEFLRLLQDAFICELEEGKTRCGIEFWSVFNRGGQSDMFSPIRELASRPIALISASYQVSQTGSTL